MTDTEKQKHAIRVMATAFKRSLSEHIGAINEKPPMELVAWSIALTELGQETTLELLKNESVTSDLLE